MQKARCLVILLKLSLNNKPKAQNARNSTWYLCNHALLSCDLYRGNNVGFQSSLVSSVEMKIMKPLKNFPVDCDMFEQKKILTLLSQNIRKTMKSLFKTWMFLFLPMVMFCLSVSFTQELFRNIKHHSKDSYVEFFVKQSLS